LIILETEEHNQKKKQSLHFWSKEQIICKLDGVAEKSPQQQWHDNECSHNLMRVAHKVIRHHLHHEWQWQAAMTTHWVHQLPTVGVDKHIIIFPKTWANHYTQSVSWVSVAFPEAMGRLRRDVGLQEQIICKIADTLFHKSTHPWRTRTYCFPNAGACISPNILVPVKEEIKNHALELPICNIHMRKG
jgi:hypothetical protein